MNKDNAHLYLPLVQALADGKTIQQFCESTDTWDTFYEGDEVEFDDIIEYYRIADEVPE